MRGQIGKTHGLFRRHSTGSWKSKSEVQERGGSNSSNGGQSCLGPTLLLETTRRAGQKSFKISKHRG